MLAYGSSYSSRDGYEGISFQSIICSVLISGLYLACSCKGLFKEFVMTIYEFNELECVGKGRGFVVFALLWGS